MMRVNENNGNDKYTILDTRNNDKISILPYKVSGSTNYLGYIYNKRNKTKEILFDGALGLHEIVGHLYDLYYNYIEGIHKNEVIYLSLILKPLGGERPETPYIVKLEGENKKTLRIKKSRDSIELLIKYIYGIYSRFINIKGQIKNKYRTDTTERVLRESYLHWHNIIVPKINTLIS